MAGGDGTRTEYQYDTRHRLTNLVKRTAAGAMILAMTYTVDASGMRTGIEESDPSGTIRTVAYQYDGQKRLTQELIDHRDDAKDRNSTWTYDAVGNRLTQTVTINAAADETTSYVYDPNDRLLSETTGGVATSYTYDANGNTLTKQSPGSNTTYTYDDANRLTAATTPDGVTTYVYNADGLRVRQTHTPAGQPSTTTWYLQDSAYPYAQVIEQHQGNTKAQKQLTATYTFADELVSQTRYDATGAASTRYVQMDGFGSTRWLTDTSGAITDSIDYSAFGEEIGRSGTTEVEHLYRGEAFDPNVGFYYLRARWMDPAVGRFVTQDSFVGFSMDPQSLHKYSYANADPINLLDPSGYMSLAEQGAVSQGVGILATLSNVSLRVYVAASSAWPAAVGGAAYLTTRGQGFVQQIAGSGWRGIQALQTAFIRVQPAVTEAEARLAANWRSFDQLKTAMNSSIFGRAQNPAAIQWHHVVEQNAANMRTFASNAINSLANVVPLPNQVHGVITNFYNSRLVLQGAQYSNARAYISRLPWERQYEIGLAALRQAAATGRIDPTQLPL